MWLHSKDPKFKEKVNEIVKLYQNPPENPVVISVDEKTGVEATERKYETQMPKPGKSGKYEYEYIRHGTQTLIAGFNTITGKVTALTGKTRKAEDLLGFMNVLAEEYKDIETIHIIWDNLNIHKDGNEGRWNEFNGKHGNRFVFHYTPIHSSWVNQIEIFFSILQKRCLRYGNFKSENDLKECMMKYVNKWSYDECHPFNWKFKEYSIRKGE